VLALRQRSDLGIASLKSRRTDACCGEVHWPASITFAELVSIADQLSAEEHRRAAADDEGGAKVTIKVRTKTNQDLPRPAVTVWRSTKQFNLQNQERSTNE